MRLKPKTYVWVLYSGLALIFVAVVFLNVGQPG